jgi:DHA2 family multidrug resistance protein
MFMRSHFETEADFRTRLIPTLVHGAAVACFFIPLVTVTLSGLKPHQIAGASGLSNFTRITAGSFGTSISTTLWDHRATLHHAQLVEHISAYNANATQALGANQNR